MMDSPTRTSTSAPPAPPAESADRGGIPRNPFDSPRHRAASSYHAPDGGDRVRRLDAGADAARDSLTASAVDGAFRAFIGDSNYPCVGAKSAVNNASYRLGIYGELSDGDATVGLCRDLFRFRHELDSIDAHFATFAAVFYGSPSLDERQFERALWQQLQALHDADAPLHAWDGEVSHDPDDSHFSFSFAGRAFFIVGLHPAASRISRRFPWPTLVFNAHDQFERLRQEGKMERMKQVIRRKDQQLQGSVNPVLRDFGDDSEARQYSGRAVEDDWSPDFEAKVPSKCPFHRLLKLGRTHHGGTKRRSRS